MSTPSARTGGSLDAWFKISQRGSTVRQEVVAGLTTFLAMVYSVIVVPGMLGKAGFPPAAVFVATCLVAGLGSIVMGLWANLPLAIGCAISLTAFTAFSLVLGQHISVPAAQGAVFVQELAEIPDEAAAAGIPIVFSAHGVSPQVKAEAARRGMHVVDATCPLVSKVHREVLRFVREGYEIIYIGHRGHDEAVGVVGEDPVHVHLIEHEADVDSLDFRPEQKLVLLTQTTLSIDETAGTIAALKCRFPWMKEPPSSDICYATSNRQAAVKLVAEQSDSVVIVGSANSSNSVRLMEVAQGALGERGRAHRVDDANELDPSWFDGVEAVGISSGASVPDELVAGVIEALRAQGFTDVSTVETIKENMHFVLPAELRRKPSQAR